MTIDFARACKDLFSTPKKWMTILGLSVCSLIPVVGQMVSLGYMIRRFSRERMQKPAEDFDFNFFGDYLMIGLWPTLATLVMSLIMMPFAFLFMIPMMFAGVLGEQSEALMAIIMGVSMILYMAVIFLFTLFFWPVMIRSGLRMDFKSGFSWRFMKSFVRKVGLSMFGYYLLLVLISIPLMILGYLALFVGVYVAVAWMQFTMFHLVFQHYDLFLQRGGERVEVNPDVVKELGMPPLPNQAGPPVS